MPFLAIPNAYSTLILVGLLAIVNCIVSPFGEYLVDKTIVPLRERARSLQSDLYYGSFWLCKTLGPLVWEAPPTLKLEPSAKPLLEELLEPLPFTGRFRALMF